MLLTLAALVGWEALRGRLSSQGTPQKQQAWGLSTSPLGLVKFDAVLLFDNPQPGQTQK